MAEETMLFPLTRQGVRDLDQQPRAVEPRRISKSALEAARPAGPTSASVECLLCCITGGALTLFGLSRGAAGIGVTSIGGAMLWCGLTRPGKARPGKEASG